MFLQVIIINIFKNIRINVQRPMDKLKLFFTAIRNCRAKHLNKELIGFKLEKKLSAVKRRDLLAYARATRDNNPLYKIDNPVLPPFFITRLMWKSVLKIITHKKLKLNLLRMVHAEQEIHWFKPVTMLDELDLKLEIQHIRESRAGEILDLSVKIYANGEKAIEAVSGILVRFSNPAAKIKIVSQKRGVIFLEVDIHTDKKQQLEYASISNDRNFIHTSRLIARLAGLPGRILHGICVMAMICSALTEKLLNNEPAHLKYMQTRFSYPVIPGEKLKLVCYKSGNKKRLVFTLENEKGRPVLKEGIFDFSN